MANGDRKQRLSSQIGQFQQEISRLQSDPEFSLRRSQELGVTQPEVLRGARINLGNLQSELDTLTRTESDIASGQALAQELIPEGASGRVKEGRSADVEDIIRRRREALEGLSSEEAMARRELAKGQIDRQTETNRRRLAAIQAGAGLRGGVAAAQQASVLQEGLAARADFERNLLLQNEQLKRDALTAFEQSVGQAEADELNRQLFNLKQQNQEQAGRLQFATSFAQLLSGERSARAQRR